MGKGGNGKANSSNGKGYGTSGKRNANQFTRYSPQVPTPDPPWTPHLQPYHRPIGQSINGGVQSSNRQSLNKQNQQSQQFQQRKGRGKQRQQQGSQNLAYPSLASLPAFQTFATQQKTQQGLFHKSIHGQVVPMTRSDDAQSSHGQTSTFTLLQLARQKGINIPMHIQQQVEDIQHQQRDQIHHEVTSALKNENISLTKATHRAIKLKQQIHQNRRAWKDFTATIDQYIAGQHGIYMDISPNTD
jgi:hypothetical protein